VRALHDPPIIVAHRGLHDDEPENSLGAFRAATREGFRWIELDVQASADHQPVIIHDPTLDRTTMGVGRVNALTGDELATVHLRHKDGSASYRHLIVLNKRRRQLPFATYLFDVKPSDANRMIKRLAQFARGPRNVIQSFDPKNLEHAKRHASKLKRHLLVESQSEVFAAVNSPWDGVNAHHASLNAQVVQSLRTAGKTVGAWTVNEPADIRRVIELNVDLIITDKPARVRDQLLAPRTVVH
jgi:glycerophosphoryl diester phosphodiesterase